MNCPDCGEEMKTVIGERADLSYGEYDECQNQNCPSKALEQVRYPKRSSNAQS